MRREDQAADLAAYSAPFTGYVIPSRYEASAPAYIVPKRKKAGFWESLCGCCDDNDGLVQLQYKMGTGLTDRSDYVPAASEIRYSVPNLPSRASQAVPSVARSRAVTPGWGMTPGWNGGPRWTGAPTHGGASVPPYPVRMPTYTEAFFSGR